MKLVYAVSESTNAPPQHGIWAPDEGESTCKIRMDLAMMGHGEQSQPDSNA